MLVFEDIHWADASLLDLIEIPELEDGGRAAADRRADPAGAVTTTARPGAADCSRRRRSRSSRSRPAMRSSSRRSCSRPGADEYAAQLAAVAEGNPFFIEELAAVVAERGANDAQGLPTTIRSILAARLDALDPDERAVLLDASVAGKVFWRGLIERLQQRSTGIGELLGSLEARGLIRREAVSRIQGEQQYSFKHSLIRQVAYAAVPRARRRERHAAVASFLEEATTETGVSAATLAYHWREAGGRRPRGDVLRRGRRPRGPRLGEGARRRAL